MNTDRDVPLPFDLYVAADLFLKTGVDRTEVLRRLALSSARWNVISRAYLWILVDDKYLGGIQALWPHVAAERVAVALVGPRWRYPDASPPAQFCAAMRGIRTAVLATPHIGPFADAGWTATHVVDDPVAYLLFYSHDGASVFFNGRRLEDSDGSTLDIDPYSFHHLGGRWYSDGKHIVGQGERGRGGSRRFYWMVEGADLASFKTLNLRYAKDGESVWYISGKRIRTVSPAAFEIVPRLHFNWRSKEIVRVTEDSLTARDAERVYSYGVVVKGADPTRFRSLGSDYWTDDVHVWTDSAKVLVAGVHAASFLVGTPLDPPIEIDAGDATDRHTPYSRGRPISPLVAREGWNAFFRARTDSGDWWWGR